MLDCWILTFVVGAEAMTLLLSLRGTKQSQREKTQSKPSVRVFYSKHENKMYREPQKSTNKHISSSDPIPTQSEAAVSSIYKQNPLKMAEALEAI